MAWGIDDAAIALLIGSAIQTAGSIYTNKKNLQAQQQQNQQNIAIAAMNNATQIDMANTAHQREIKDLRAAGLNPLLSAQGGGASVPQLQQASLRAPQMDNPVSNATQSATALSKIINANTQADTAQKMANTSNLVEQNKNLQEQNKLLQAQTRETDARTYSIMHPASLRLRDTLGTAKDGLDAALSKIPPSRSRPMTVKEIAAAEKALESPAKPIESHSAQSESIYDQLKLKEMQELMRRDGLILKMSDTPGSHTRRHFYMYTR